MNRWTAAGAAMAVGGLTVVVSTAAAAPDVRRVAIEAGVIGWAVLAVAVAWRAPLLTPALVGLGLPAALLVVHRTTTATAVVPAAALLVATAELAAWSFDLRSVVPEASILTARRAASTAGLTAGAAVAAAGVLVLGGLPAPGGPLPLVVGTGAALAIVALATVRRW